MALAVAVASWTRTFRRLYTAIVKSDSDNTCTVDVCYNQVTTSESRGDEAIQEAGNFR